MVFSWFHNGTKGSVAHKKSSNIIWAVLLLVVGFFVGASVNVVGNSASLNNNHNIISSSGANTFRQAGLPTEFKSELYNTVWRAVTTKALKKDATNSDFFYGSLKGMVAMLQDPYSLFLDPKETQEFQSELDGAFDGIGAEVGIKNDAITVIAPLPGTPAERQGLRAGDVIISIDGESTVGMGLNKAVLKIRGKKGTAVVFVVRSRGATNDKTLTITRDTINVPMVTLENKKDVALVRFYHFGPGTKEAFESIKDRLLLEHPAGVIVDVRNNPGGILDEASAVAGAWVESGRTVVTEVSGDGQQQLHASTGGAGLARIPVVVLVNKGTASAAEILAGALHFYNHAPLVGEQTFGKGTVQEFQTFDDGSSLKLTIAKWLTPDGTDITEHGLTPDTVVEFSDTAFAKGEDPQLVRALEIVRGMAQ